MAEGKYANGMFYLLRVMHPPLLAKKNFKFQLNEQDYFGSYTKMTENLIMQKHKESDMAHLANLAINPHAADENQGDLEQCVVVVS